MPAYKVEIDGKAYRVDDVNTPEEAEAAVREQLGQSTPAPQPAPEVPTGPTAPPGQLAAPTAAQSFDAWKKEKLDQMAHNKGLDVVGGTTLDALGLTSRPVQAVMAGINAKRTGQGGFTKTALAQLAGGNVIDAQGNQMADVTYGWKPKSLTGRATKSILNVGRDVVGLSGVLGGLGKAARLIPGVAEGMEAMPTALKMASQVPKFVETTAPNALISPLIKKTGSIIGNVSRETMNKFVSPGVKEGIAKVLRPLVSPKIGVKEEALKVGQVAKETKNARDAFVSTLQENVNRILRSVDNASRPAENLRLGHIMTGDIKAVTPAEQGLRDTFVKLHQADLGHIKSWQARLTNLGNDVENNLSHALDKQVAPEAYYPRVLELNPADVSPKNVKKILASFDENIAQAQARRAAGEDVGDVVEKLQQYKKLYEGKTSEELSKALMNDERLGGFMNDRVMANSVEKPDSMGLAVRPFTPRQLPEHLAQVFKPMKDSDSLLSAERSYSNAHAAMEARVGALEGQSKGLIPKASPEEVDKFLEDAKQSGMLKGIEHMIPDVNTDKVTYEYLSQLLGQQAKWEKTITDYPLMKWTTNTWKSFKLFNPASIFRNFIQGSSLAAQHGISQTEYIPAVRTAFKMSSGKMNEIPKDLRVIYSKLNGSGTSLALDKVMEPTTIKAADGTEEILKNSKIKQTIGDIWNNLGHSFRSTDDGLRIAMFNKKVQDFSKLPLKAAVKDENAVRQAIDFVNKNTIQYDELPALARMMKMVNPFFSFNFRAPKQYLKGMIENPALTARYKTGSENETQRNLAQVPPGLRSQYENGRNRFAEALNTFGGNIVITPGGKVNGIPAMDYINMAPLSYSMRQSTPGQFNESLGSQVGDVALQMSGVDMSGRIPPVAPAVGAIQAISAIPGLMGGGNKQSVDNFRNSVQTLSPTVLNQGGSLLAAGLTKLPPKIYAKIPGKQVLAALTPKQGSSMERNTLSALGIGTKPETYEQLGNTLKTSITQSQAEMDANVRKYVDSQFPNDPQKANEVFTLMLQQRKTNFLKTLGRKLAGFKEHQ